MDKYINFFKAHERLALVIVVLAAGLWAHLAWLGYHDRKDLRDQGAAHEKLQTDAAVANARLDQAQKSADDLKVLLVQSNQRITALETAVVARDRAAVVQQVTDRQLAPDQLASRIQQLAPGGSVTVTLDAGYRLDRPEAETVAAKLELVDPLQKDVADLRTANAEKDNQVAAYKGQVDILNEAVVGLKQELADTGYEPNGKGNLECRSGQCQADVKVARDNEAKKHRKLEVILTILAYVAGRKGI